MNKYYKFAIVSAIILALLFIPKIWFADLSDVATQKRIEYTISTGELICSLLTVLFVVIGVFDEQRRRNAAISVQNKVKRDNAQYLEREESIDQYLLNLKSYLEQYSIAPSAFIQLSAEVRSANSIQDIDLLQKFVWTKRHWQSENLEEVNKSVNILQAHEMFRNYVLLGEPGSGKTTCMQYLIFDLIRKYREGTSTLLPIYVTLSEWKDRQISAIEFIQSSLEKLAGPASYLSVNFENLLSQGKFLVVLDGLNEMPNRFYKEEEEVSAGQRLILQLSGGDLFRPRQDTRERSLRELATADAVRSKFIVTCRTHEFFQLPSWQEIHILPMHTENIHLFIEYYLPPDAANELKKVISGNVALLELAANPFFLKNMVGIYASDLESIASRGRFLEYLLSKSLLREQQLGKNFDPDKTMRVICRVAFFMMKNDNIGSRVELERIPNKARESVDVLLGTGLLIAHTDRGVFFYHQLIQEFMTALALREKWVHANIQHLLRNKKWSEVILLWHDISGDNSILPKLLRSLKQRNMPWFGLSTKPISISILNTIYAIVYLLSCRKRDFRSACEESCDCSSTEVTFSV